MNDFAKRLGLITLAAVLLVSGAWGQTTLSPGDLMMVTINADGNDNFDFVPLVDLEAGTVINFTDNAWIISSESFRSGEGVIIYTASSSVTAGTIVSYPGSTGGEWSSSGSFDISGSGDNILVYQDISTFIYGIGWAISSPWIESGEPSTNNSNIPSTLSGSEYTIVTLGTYDNYQYNTSNGSSGTPSELLQLIANGLNWSGDNSNVYIALSQSFTVNSVGDPIPPSITNILHEPTTDITSSISVSVSADVTAGDAALDHVELHWNTTNDFGTYTTIGMSVDAGDTYVTDTDIPAQSDGTTVYYRIYAEDIDTESSTSAVQSYSVTDPKTTTLPYAETFDSNLGDCYTYSVSGVTKEWYQTSGYAAMNGYNSGDTEEDWLILPGIDLDNYSDEIMIFETWYNYGTDDVNNYLKLMYSTDYAGVGDPSLANWTDLSYTQPSSATTWTSSGNIDLSAISGTSVWIAFKYHYEAGSYRSWSVDNINIYELTPEPSNHVSSFSATADNHQSITLTWSDNDGATTAHGFLVGLTSDAENAFEPVDGTPVANADGPTDWVRNVAHGVETVTINGLSAETQYYAKIWPYTNSGDEIDYKIDGTVPAESATTAATPVVPTAGVVFISEVSDASGTNNEYIELFNNSDNTIDLSNSKIVMLSDGKNFPFINYVGDYTIQPNGLLIMARGATKLDFESEWGTLPENCNYNVGSSGMYFGTSTARRWQLVYNDGVGDNIIDDTQNTVAGSGNRSYQQPIGTWNTDALSSATPGTLDPDQALPITLASFSAEAANGKVHVTWVTESETENAAFRIYRDDEMITEIEGAGTTSEPQRYSYTDQYVIPGRTYSYVLADVDYQGKETKHPRVEVEVKAEGVDRDYTIGAAYPNPFNPVTLVPLNLAKDARVTATLYDITGRPLRELQNGSLSAGSHTLKIDGSALSTGIYFVHINVNNAVHVQKIALMK